MDPRRHRYLEALGLPLWVQRVTEETVAPYAGTDREKEVALPVAVPGETPVMTIAPDTAPEAILPARRPVDEAAWQTLEARVAACTTCDLHRSRTQTVFGTGDRAARWLLVGEAPGADEDRQGEPFVGRAGKLLNSMIQALGMERGQVYIANILKCRPPNNRDPLPAEVISCEAYLERQIALLSPQVILAVGRIAAQNLLKVDTPIGEMRGRRYHYRDTGIPLVVTYHPAYLLRSPAQKAKVWQDLKLALRITGNARLVT